MYQQKIYHSTASTKNKKPIFKNVQSQFQPCCFENILPSLIFQQYQPCQCSTYLTPCHNLLSILNPNQLQQAIRSYKLLVNSAKSKYNATDLAHNMKQIQKQLSKEKIRLEEIFMLHIQQLSCLIQPGQALVIYKILKHAKCQYLTFWIYCQLCLLFPRFVCFRQTIDKIITKNNITGLSIGDNTLKKVHQLKLANIFENLYFIVLRIILRHEQKQIVQRIVVSAYMVGRDRNQTQIIKAALILQPAD